MTDNLTPDSGNVRDPSASVSGGAPADQTVQQQIDNAAIDTIAVKMAQNYILTSFKLNKTLADADKLKDIKDKDFTDNQGKFDRQKFNAYVKQRAADIYDGQSDFAQKSLKVMEETVGDDPKSNDSKTEQGWKDKKGWISILKNHKALSAAAADVVSDYTTPVPILSPIIKFLGGLFGVDVPDVSFKTIGLFIQGIFKHGFDFGAIKQDIADQAAQEYKAKIKGLGLDDDTVTLATQKFQQTAGQKLGLPSTSTEPAETLNKVKIIGFDEANPSNQAGSGTGSTGQAPGAPGSGAGNPAPGDNVAGGSSIDQRIDTVIKTTLASNSLATAGLDTLKASASPPDKLKYQAITDLQQSFSDNAKQIAVDVKSGKITDTDPKTLADMAFKKTFDALSTDKKHLLGLDAITPNDTVDTVLNGLSSKSDEGAVISAFFTQLRNNVGTVLKSAAGSTGPSQTSGAGTDTSAGATPPSTVNQVQVVQKAIDDFNTKEIVGIAQKSLPASIEQSIAIKASENPKKWGITAPDFAMKQLLGRDQNATNIVRNYIKDTRKNGDPKAQTVDGARDPSPKEVAAFKTLNAWVISKNMAPTGDQLNLVASTIGEVSRDYLNDLAKNHKPLPSKEQMAPDLNQLIKTRLPLERDANNHSFDELGPSLSTLNKNIGTDLVGELTKTMSDTLINNIPKKNADGSVAASGAYDQLKQAYSLLTNLYTQQAQATANQAGIKPTAQLASAGVTPGTMPPAQSTPPRAAAGAGASVH